MPQSPVCDYHYGHEADQYTFYRLPKALFTDNRYKDMSDGAKILYGLMLDRMGLSMKNGWLDEQGRVYIYFTLEDVMEYMNCQRDKGMKILSELDTVKGVGLIERIRQGLGKPSIIYVKKFIQAADLLKSEKPTSEQPDSPIAGSRKNRPLEVGNTDPNNTDINKTEKNETQPEVKNITNDVRPSCPSITAGPRALDGLTDKSIKGLESFFRTHIRYMEFWEAQPYDMKLIDEIIAIMVDVVVTPGEYVIVGGENKPRDLVSSRLMWKLDHRHIGHVVEQYKTVTTPIKKKRQYLLTMLYNATLEYDAHIENIIMSDGLNF